jgi:hypothetical protein
MLRKAYRFCHTRLCCLAAGVPYLIATLARLLGPNGFAEGKRLAWNLAVGGPQKKRFQLSLSNDTL